MPRTLALLSLVVSVALAIPLLVSVMAELRSRDRSEAIGQPIRTMTQAAQYLNRAYPKGIPLRRVYTGLYIQSIEFVGANNVIISGYVWQRYRPSVPKNVTPGVAFPEAQNSYNLTKVYQSSTAKEQSIGWHFELTVRQKFDYRRYPLDRQSVRIRMWHADFDSGALLIPDLRGYPRWIDEKFRGVDREAVFDQWVPNYTFFSYHKIPYEAAFGYGNFAKATGRPELYFNMGFRRSIYGAFLGQIIPMLFVALIMFASLFPGSTDPEHAEATGFNTIGVVGFCVTMLLVVVIQHAEIRQDVGGATLSYLDYLQFVLYGVISLVTINAILVRRLRAPRWVQWRDNLAPKLLYWPVLLGGSLLITLSSFN